MPEAVIVATGRTPIGRAFKGSLIDMRPDDLTALIVKAVLAKVALGEADAGLVYATDAREADAANVKRLLIPDTLNTVAAYSIAVVNDTPHSAAARDFVSYVLASEGQLILSEYGFMPGVTPPAR